MTKRPGVLFYFDVVRPIINFLPRDQLGDVFAAAVEYAGTGALPDLDGNAAFSFEMLRPHIDRDGERYQDTITDKRYAGYCSAERKAGREPLPREEWEQKQQVLTGVDRCQQDQPTSTATSNTTSNTTPAPAPTPAAAPQPWPPELVYTSDGYIKCIDGIEIKATEEEVVAYLEARKAEQLKKLEVM